MVRLLWEIRNYTKVYAISYNILDCMSLDNLNRLDKLPIKFPYIFKVSVIREDFTLV